MLLYTSTAKVGKDLPSEESDRKGNRAPSLSGCTGSGYVCQRPKQLAIAAPASYFKGSKRGLTQKEVKFS